MSVIKRAGLGLAILLIVWGIGYFWAGLQMAWVLVIAVSIIGLAGVMVT
ncbi:MAG: hypothetical protein QM612_04155 [Thermomonas sp.]